MNRIALTGDDTGKWFDESKAVKFKEATWWNGNNHISKPTGSQWDHEALYFTASGNWELNDWSQYQGSSESYETIHQDDAIRWLIVNEHADHLGELPQEVQDAVRAGVEAVEV